MLSLYNLDWGISEGESQRLRKASREQWPGVGMGGGEGFPGDGRSLCWCSEGPRSLARVGISQRVAAFSAREAGKGTRDVGEGRKGRSPQKMSQDEIFQRACPFPKPN